MHVICRNGLLLAGLIALAGCQRGGSGEYHVITEESLEEPPAVSVLSPPATTGDAAAPDPEAAAVAESSRIHNGPGDVAQARPAPAAGLADVAGEAGTVPPSPPLPSQSVAIVPPERGGSGKLPGEASDPRTAVMLTDNPRNTGTGRGDGQPREIRLLIPDKEFSPEGLEQALRVTFDDIDLLKVLNMEPVPPTVMEYLPGWLAALDGQRIILRGWMYPPGRQEGITRFMFVRDNGICCFGREPKVYDKLGVTLRSGQTTKYIEGRPFDVIGTLSIAADVEGDEVFWLYHLDDAVVIDK